MLARLFKAGTLFVVSTAMSVAQPLTTSDSANWYRDAAVSPDGSQIVFRYSGQIWLVSSQGGDAIPLTSESVFSSHPVWSPDGKTIAFTSNRYGSGDVFTMDVESGDLKRLTYHPVRDVPYAFSADGKRVYFESFRIGRSDLNLNDGLFGRAFYLYSVDAKGGREKLELANGISSFDSAHQAQGFLYTDRPSFVEQEYRKHQTSAAARDIWLYKGGKHLQLTQYKGDDREARFSSDDSAMYYLTERSGSFNVWRKDLNASSQPQQETFFSDLPVRSLSVSSHDDLVFSYDGDIWLKAKDDDKSHKVKIRIRKQGMKEGSRNVNLKYEISEFAISPTAPEAAIVARGDIFVVSMLSGNVIRVTHTPQKEASVSFSADGKSLYYTSERHGNWDIYKSAIADGDKSFISAGAITETAVTQTDKDETQPLLSPDNSKLAYRVNSNSLVVENLKDKSIQTLITAKEFYSYDSGDWNYSWSPDSRYMVSRLGSVLGQNQIALFDTSGKQRRVVLSNSGFLNLEPRFSQDGQIVYWFTPRDGNTELDGSPVAGDIYALALNSVADYNWFRPEDSSEIASNTKDENKSTLFEANGLDKRLHRLTPFSLNITNAFLSPDNKDLLVVYSQKGNYVFADLNTQTGEFNQMFTRPKGSVKDIQMAPDNASVVILGNGMLDKINLANHESEVKSFDVEAEFNFSQERDYIFDHVWRMTKNRFYDKDLHGVDWDKLGQHYARYLPSIHTYQGFAEMLSEMVGELNASHTGASYFAGGRNWEKVASLGLFYDDAYEGIGVRVDKVLPNGPLDLPNSPVKHGSVIVAVNGKPIDKDKDIYPYLRNLKGKLTTLTVKNPDSDKSQSVQVFPVTIEKESQLSYRYWASTRKSLTEQLSENRIGYIHVQQMETEDYKTLVDKLFGENQDKDAVVIDIRYNTGGNIHDQFIDLLSGVNYGEAVSRDGYKAANFPLRRWTKPTILLANPSSYSDASVVAKLYQDNHLGQLVGDSVPGTGTFVNWQIQQEPMLEYGVPQLGIKDSKGRWLENQDVIPDVLVHNYPESVARNRDVQLETAVKQLLVQLDRKE